MEAPLRAVKGEDSQGQGIQDAVMVLGSWSISIVINFKLNCKGGKEHE